jgi:hypothetical protein
MVTVVNGAQNPTPDGGIDQKGETIPVLQNCLVLAVVSEWVLSACAQIVVL